MKCAGTYPLVADLIHYRLSAGCPAAFQSKLFTIFDSCVDSSGQNHGISLDSIAESPDTSVNFQGDISNAAVDCVIVPVRIGGLRQSPTTKPH